MPDAKTPFQQRELLKDLDELFAPARDEYHALRYTGAEPRWQSRTRTARFRTIASAALVLFAVGLMWHREIANNRPTAGFDAGALVVAATPSAARFSALRMPHPSIRTLRPRGQLSQPRKPPGKAFRFSPPRPPRPVPPARIGAIDPPHWRLA